VKCEAYFSGAVKTLIFLDLAKTISFLGGLKLEVSILAITGSMSIFLLTFCNTLIQQNKLVDFRIDVLAHNALEKVRKIFHNSFIGTL
jgi:hypothetical protein